MFTMPGTELNPMFNAQQSMELRNTNFVNNDKRAMLILLSRKAIPDQVRRPLQYKFGGEFRMALQETLEKNANMAGPTNMFNATMPDVAAARSAILPDAVGHPLYLAPFADYWTFILVVDNDSGMSRANLVSSVPNRMIYSGWVTDEPFTIGNMGAGMVHNPAAVFSTTHHVTLSAHSIMTPAGMIQTIDTTGDYDYVPGMTAKNIMVNNSDLYSISPSDTINSITRDNEVGSFTLSAPDVAAHRGSIELPTDLNSPTHHLQKIIGGIGDAIRFSQTGQFNDSLDIFSGHDVFMDSLKTTMRNTHNSVLNELDPSMPFTFGDLMNRYGTSLNVIPVNAPFESQVGLGDPMAPTARNVFTSLLADTIPGLMAQFGICEIAFSYDSYQRVPGGLGSTNEERGVMNVQNIGSLYPIPDAELQKQFDTFVRYLKFAVFPIIQTNVGHFQLHAHCSICGVSLINLNLYDEMPAAGFIENNTLLAGLCSPMLGNSINLQTNASEFVSVIDDTKASGSMSGGQLGMPLGMNYPPVY